jgi:hypothetical protein
MALAENEHQIQTLGSGRPDHRSGMSLARGDLNGVRICLMPRLFNRRSEHLPVAAVAVMDEKTRWFTIPATAFDDLVRHPLCCGMASHLNMQDLAVGMTDRKENTEGLEPDRLHAEEIASPDIPGMPLEKFSQPRDGFPS